jgi:hypothetical protein
MEYYNEGPTDFLSASEVTSIPAGFTWRDQGREIFLCNPEVVQTTDGNDNMMLRYMVVIEGEMAPFRVWRPLGFNHPTWYACDVTGALVTRGATPSQAMMRILL